MLGYWRTLIVTSHSHRRFSAVNRHAPKIGNRLNCFWFKVSPVHRAKAAVRIRMKGLDLETASLPSAC